MGTTHLAIVLFLLTPFNLNASEPNETATWVWHTEDIIHQPDEVLVFLQKKGVSHLYLQVNQNVQIGHYQHFIEKANQMSINVHALDGSPTWVDRMGRVQYIPIINWLTQYQQSSTTEQRFTGLHIDVEPYLCPRWFMNRRATIEEYQQVILDFKQTTRQLNIEFGIDIPFWFDSEVYFNKRFGSGKLSEWLIDQADSTTVMAYRDHAENLDGIIDIVKDELVYANKKGKNIYIAVETDWTTEGNLLTFLDNGEASMLLELDKVKSIYKRYRYFRGFAIHHYRSWRALRK
ncbi:amidase [Halalkalibacter urbisdiaboli]|uniref:amidase n=1 Tax=Halalkalibacter urbisdiaboli TaxID=1960589 RepID=UPI001054FEBD|nr:amidase [Halalkalibacter urbisdiaboli]